MSDKKEENGAPRRPLSYSEKVDQLVLTHWKECENQLIDQCVELQLDTPEAVENCFRALLGEAVDDGHEFSETDMLWFSRVAKNVSQKLQALEASEKATQSDVGRFEIAIQHLSLPTPTRQEHYWIWSFHYDQDTAWEATRVAKALLDAFGHLNSAGLCGRPFFNIPAVGCLEVKVGHLKHRF